MKFLLLALGVIALWWFLASRDEESGILPSEVITVANPGSSSLPDIRLIEQSPMITDYGAEGGSVQEDLRILRAVVRDCQMLMKDFDRYHLPDNPAITRFLQGGNPDKLAWISQSHSFVDEKGQLLDRNGKAVIFHRLSGMKIEFRSAGPDGQAWTDDDIIVGQAP